MLRVPVSMIIASHLSDIQIELGHGIPTPNYTSTRLNFVKYLVHFYKDTRTEVDADAVYNEFKSNYPLQAAA